MLVRGFCRLKTIRRRAFMSTSVKSKGGVFNDNKINSWQIHSYGGLEELQLEKTKSPVVRNPHGVIVQVLATSINPLDVAMIGGYGSVLLNFMRQVKRCSLEKQIEFPLTLGRDFAGVVIQKGHSVGNKFNVGDEVWGVVPPQDQGSHAEQVIVSEYYLQKKPNNISMTEAGSLLYAAITAWSALKITGDLAILGGREKTVLVLGGSGGVGTMAVQMLRNWGVHVVATCSADAIPLLHSLGIKDVIDYKAEDAREQIGSRKNYLSVITEIYGQLYHSLKSRIVVNDVHVCYIKPGLLKLFSFMTPYKIIYDIIFDCAGLGQESGREYCQYLKDYHLSKFITLKSPMLRNVDDYGILGGMMKNVGDLLITNISTGVLPKSSSVRWGFFMPFEQALIDITKYVEEGKILPCVQRTYSFEDLPKAYKHVSDGHLRGKIVIDMLEKA